MRRRSLSSPLFPYTTLFRSAVARSLPQLCYESGDLFDSAVEFHGFVLVGVFCFRTNVLLRLLLVEVAFDGVENAVDKLRSFVSGKTARNLEGFVDCDGARRRLVKKFVDGEAQDVAIDDGHAGDTPVFGSRTDAIVKEFEIRKSSLGQASGESAGGRVEVGLSQCSPIAADHSVRRHFDNVSRKVHLQGTFACL